MKHQIMVVDDSRSDVELLLVVLRSICSSLEIYVAYDGQEAVDFLLNRDALPANALPSFSLVLLDIKMPKVDGFEVLTALKSHARTKMIPVIMFTSSNEERDVETSYQLGANGYVVKPVDFQEYQDLLSGIVGYWLDTNRIAVVGEGPSAHTGIHVPPGVTVIECRASVTRLAQKR